MRSIPTQVQAVLDAYISFFNEQFPNMLEGLYIHGSIAIDAYVNNSSDIDFITVLNRSFSQDEMMLLSELHSKIVNQYKYPELDGVYIKWEELGKLDSNDKDNVYYSNGKLRFGPYFNFNPITWSVSKSDGLTVIGPEIQTLEFTVSKDDLVTYVMENMNSYWTPRIQKIEGSIHDLLNLSTKEIDTEIEWSILGILRQYYTVKEHKIISKHGAGEYALQHISEEWHNMIREAINIRTGVKETLFKSEKQRIETFLACARYLLNECKQKLFVR
ncbi:aminoglycoside adenylyltransferase domain-containing protein [Cytobacillus sp. Hm23]